MEWSSTCVSGNQVSFCPIGDFTCFKPFQSPSLFLQRQNPTKIHESTPDFQCFTSQSGGHIIFQTCLVSNQQLSNPRKSIIHQISTSIEQWIHNYKIGNFQATIPNQLLQKSIASGHFFMTFKFASNSYTNLSYPHDNVHGKSSPPVVRSPGCWNTASIISPSHSYLS